MDNISFPGLGLELDISNSFNLFGFNLYWYGFIIALGLVVAFIYALLNCKRFGIKQDDIFDGIIFGIPISIIGARAFYVLFSDWSEYDGFWSVVNIRNGGLAIYGALISVIIMIYIFSRIKKLKMGSILDLTSLGFLLGQAIGRWGNFLNREVYGKETDLPWRMQIGSGGAYHPLFLYESLWNILGFFLLHFYSKSKKKKFDGEIFLMYLVWYGVGRGFMEGLRDEQFILKLGAMPISQIVSFIFAICAFIAIIVIRSRISKREKETSEDYTPMFEQVKDSGEENIENKTENNDLNNEETESQDT